MVFEMRVGKSGKCESTRIVRARMRSRSQLTFDQVQRFLDEPKNNPLPDRDAEASLALLPAVGEVRLQDAQERNVIHYRRSETEVKLEVQPPMRFVIELGMRSKVERYNEQLSLMCNVEGAMFLRHGDEDNDLVQPIYRVHPQPAIQRLEDLEQLLTALATRHGLPLKRWTWKLGASLGDFLQALPREGKAGRIARAIHRQAVITNVRSTFSDKPGRHHGVGADVYARFSAPMREIVGVFVHKEAFEKLGERAAPNDRDNELRTRVVERANDAKALQKVITKQANHLVLDELFESDRKLGRDHRPWRRGTVMGMTRGKAHVMLDDPAVEVKVYSRHLERQLGGKVDLSEDKVQLERDGEVVCRIGEEVDVRVHDRDRGEARWVMSMRVSSE